ncbi:HlyD family type I secretion periplasmic adaptor subunit [Ruegeria sp. 2205SS24-7]|uniref:HlyD family type I secretion periplasmic adaptor subunit n=1 Tax=Ruegeria discodermiae TaxID=3064389 RepID=UPI002741A386|nr:HlyD family type I secretion periplasmic adaptor subunit [Ruegeria sp. 2205SS24-7]MDP5220675.1 HlyD family type I secretion periplasmic adaptor subunit [Ruegeria sp. 2205SS24-7]
MSTKKPKLFPSTGPLMVGVLTLVILIGGFGAWGVLANISGAVVASGRVVVDKNRQVVQHPDGGVVEAVLVEEGDVVKEDDILVKLDPTLLKSELTIVEGQLFELMARRGRLEAERDSTDEVRFDRMLLENVERRPEIAAVAAGQVRLFEARREAQAKEIEQLRAQRTQLNNQIEGVDAQMDALTRQQELIESELESQQVLLDKGLAQASRVMALQREEAQLAGTVGNLVAQRAQTLERIAELEIEELQLYSARREQAITRLRDLQFNELELAEQRRSLIERLSRLDIRAPISGVVYDLQVFGRRSVIRPADPTLFLVSQDRPLIIEARIDPIHVDQVYPGQEVVMRVAAFDQRNSPDLFGSVTLVSPDSFVDDQTGASWYRVELELPEEELGKLGEDQILIPGMPVDAFIRTQDRTPLAYLANPLTSYFSKAFRDG